MGYNPIVRNFNRIRRVLMETLDLPRESVKPTSTFASLVPRQHRRHVWKRFRQENLELDALHMSVEDFVLIVVVKYSAFVLPFVFWPELYCAWAALALAIGIFVTWGIVLFIAEEIDPAYTIGDAALAMATVDQCDQAGYRLNRKEIFLKVRRVIVETLNVDPAEITPDKKLMDLGIE